MVLFRLYVGHCRVFHLYLAIQAYELVLAEAGAISPRRDAVDKRVINEVRSKAGRCIDDPSDVGGWPTLDPGKPPADTDHDGIPDAWEKQHRLNPHNPEDRNGKARSGYKWVEEYVNSLVPRNIMNKGGQPLSHHLNPFN